jgi:HEAT repeat protein
VDQAWSVLSTGPADQNFEQRVKAVRTLGALRGEQRAREMAEKALEDEKSAVRAAAAEALGQMGARESVDKLKSTAKNDKEADVVFAAGNAVFVLEDPTAFALYYAVLTGEKKSGEGLIESQMKMVHDPRALAKFGFEQGIGFIPFAGVGYQAFKAVKKDDASPIRAAAAVKLAKDPDPKSAEALKDKSWLVRSEALTAFAERGDPAFLKVALPLFSDENDTVRFNAAAVVLRLSAKL